MKLHSALAVLPWAGLLLSGAVLAAGPFDGTWKTKLDSIEFSSRPDVYELKDGMFRCASCAPDFNVKADGTDQQVSGHNYYDTVAVKVIDARTVELSDKLNGKPTYQMRLLISEDGKTLDTAFKDFTGAQVATWNQLSTRVAAASAKAHAVSGSWKMDKMPSASDVGTTVIYRMNDEGMQMDYNGMTYDAKFDGKPVLTSNDPGKTMVSLKRLSANVIEETDTRMGKVTDVTRMTVSADGKSMMIVDKDKTRDMTMSFTMTKQP